MGQSEKKDQVQEKAQEIGESMQPEPQREKKKNRLVSWIKKGRWSEAADKKEELENLAPVILTGGHGGAVPAFIVWLTRKLFLKSKDS